MLSTVQETGFADGPKASPETRDFVHITDYGDLLTRDSSNVDLALTRFCAGYKQVFLSDSNHLERLDIFVAGAGFEPAAFRL